MFNHEQDKLDAGAASLPPVRAVQAFEAIVRCGSVTAAADELGISSGAVSQQLHKLERELDVRLLKREGRSLTLTSWGRIYYEQIQIAFDGLRRAQHRLQLARTKQNIAISVPPSMSLWVQRPLLQWSQAHPAVDLQLIGSENEVELQNESIDFRICYGPDARRYDRFSELFRDAVVPACSPNLLQGRPVHQAADILTHPLINIVWNSHHRQLPSWADWAWSAGLAPPQSTGHLTFSLSSAGIDAALDGGGFVLAQISLITEHVRQGRLVIPIDQRLNLPEAYYLAWERDALDRQICADFRYALISAARQQHELSNADALAPPPTQTRS